MARILFIGIPLFGYLFVGIPTCTNAEDQQEASQIVNPFEMDGARGGSGNGRVTTRISDQQESDPAFHLPTLPALPKPSLPKIQLLPSWGHGSTSSRNEPSIWQKIDGGTKSFFAKTRKTLAPWSIRQADSSRRTGSSSRRTNQSASGPTAFLSSWFKPKEEEKEIRTANEWLSLPRVPYD